MKGRTIVAIALICAMLLPLCGVPAAAQTPWEPVMNMEFGVDTAQELLTQSGTEALSEVSLTENGVVMTLPSGKQSARMLDFKETATPEAEAVVLDNGTYYLEFTYIMEQMTTGMLEIRPKGLSTTGAASSTSSIRFENGKVFVNSNATDTADLVQGQEQTVGWLLKVDGQSKGHYTLYCNGTAVGGEQEWQYSAVTLTQADFLFNNYCDGKFTLKSVKAWKQGQELTTPEQDAQAVAQDKEELTVGEGGYIYLDFELPTVGENGSAITWQSNGTGITVEDGKAKTHPDAQEQKAELTATLQKNNARDTKVFTLTVPANLNLGKPATASESHDSGLFGPEKTVDGDRSSSSSRWSAHNKAAAWLQYDLQTPTAFDKLVIYDFNGRIQECTLQGSNDGIKWDLLATETYSGTAAREINIDRVTYQYLRLTITKYADTPSIYELEVYHLPTETEQEKFEQDVASVNETSILNGQEKERVTENITLPTVLANGTTVVWDSNMPEVISKDGTVTRSAAENKTVTLTAAFSMLDGALTASKSFTVTVLQAESVFMWKEKANMVFGENTPDGLFTANGTTPRNVITKTAYGVQIKRQDDQQLCTDEIFLRQSAEAGAPEVVLDEGKYYLEVTYQIDQNDNTIDLGMRGTNAAGEVSSSTNVRFLSGTELQYRNSNDALTKTSGYTQGVEQTVGYELDINGQTQGNFKLYLNRKAETESMVWKWGAVEIDRLSLSLNNSTNGIFTLKSIQIWKYEEATEQEAFESDYNSLTEELILNGQQADNVTGDLNLPEVLPLGTKVSWTSSPEGIVAQNGTVTRPEEADQEVTLYAAVQTPSGGTAEKQFVVVVKKALIPAIGDEQAVAYDKKELFLLDTDWVGADFALPQKGEKGSTITWQSDNAAIEVNGDTAKVDLTKAGTVTLTATLTKGTAQDTKQFYLAIGSNVALGKTATASNTHSSGYAASQALDGDREVSRWATTAGAPQWMRVDLGQETTFNHVNVYDYNGRCQNISIQGSHDDKTWETIQTQEYDNSGAGSFLLPIDLPDSTYRYVRLLINKAKDQPSIYEFEIYYNPVTATLQDRDALNEETVTEEPLSQVTKNTKVLPITGENGSTITWESSDTNVLEMAQVDGGMMGLLHRPVGEDRTIRLTAYLNKEGCNERKKTYLLTVQGERSGLYYSIDETFDSEGLPDNVWNGSGTIDGGSLSVSLSDSPAELFPLTKAVTIGGEFQAELVLKPQQDSGEFQIQLLDTQQQPLVSVPVWQEDGIWFMKTGGQAARGITNNVNEAVHVKLSLTEGGTVLRTSCNGVLLGAELLPDNTGIRSIALQATDGSTKIAIEDVQVYLQQSQVLDIVADGLNANAFTEQEPDKITKNLNFSAQIMDGILCSWATSNAEVVSAQGTVTRESGTAATEVTITQTVYLAADPDIQKEISHTVYVLQVDKTNELVDGRVSVSGASAQGSEQAADGTRQTVFQTEKTGTKPIEIQVDAGWLLPVTEIELNEGKVEDAYHIQEYQLAVSADGTVWNIIKEGESVGESLVIPYTGEKIRYIKWTINKADGAVGIAEISARTPRGDLEEVAATDLAELLKELPSDGSILSQAFTVPLTGHYGSDVNLSVSPSSSFVVTKVTAGDTPYYRISLTKSNTEVSAQVRVSVSFRDQSAEQTLNYTVEKGTSTGGIGGGGGGGGSSSSGSSGGGSGFVGTTSGGTENFPPSEPVSTQDPFAQELSGRWCEKEVRALLADGIVKGVSEHSLGLENQTTRAEFITMLVRLMGLDTQQTETGFSDVSPDDWYAPYIAAAAANGLVQGADGKVRPEDVVSREEMAKMALAAYEKMTGETVLIGDNIFVDQDAISGWAMEAVTGANKLGLIQGFEDGTFRPAEPALREQVIVIIYRLKEATA